MELLRDFLRKKKVIANEVAKKLPKQQTISISDSEGDIYDVYHEAEGHPRIEKADWLNQLDA